MDQQSFHELLEHQSGVISRRQLHACGGTDDDLRRLLRRRALSRVHRGVYVNHTGPLSWSSRAWAAVLSCWPAVLCHRSVVDPGGDLIHVAVDESRRVTRVPGVRVHRVTRLDRVARWNTTPPKIQLEHAVLHAASDARDEVTALATVADTCQKRRTTPARLVAMLRRQTRLRRRAFLLEVLADVAERVHSVLEHRYLTRVERPHGLPTAKRQRPMRVERRAGYRDVEYPDQRLLVELDGRLGHEEAFDRWHDIDRDLAAARERRTTTRLGWRQVLDPCPTAIAVAELLRLGGWAGQPRPCRPTCPVNGEFRAGAA